MTTLREAAAAALEALENGKKVRAGEGGTKYQIPLEDNAIADLKAALAEPQEQPLDRCPGCGGPADNGWDRSLPPAPYFCSKCMAEPQEPVAWMYPDDYERMTTSETWANVFSVQISSPTQGKTTVPLYTHPAPQRQRLSGHEIRRIVDETVKDVTADEHVVFHEVVRAIERAHGIGGQDE